MGLNMWRQYDIEEKAWAEESETIIPVPVLLQTAAVYLFRVVLPTG